jgi:hypothetical protein
MITVIKERSHQATKSCIPRMSDCGFNSRNAARFDVWRQHILFVAFQLKNYLEFIRNRPSFVIAGVIPCLFTHSSAHVMLHSIVRKESKEKL